MMTFWSNDNFTIAICSSNVFWIKRVPNSWGFEILFSFFIDILSSHSQIVKLTDFPKLLLPFSSFNIISWDIVSSLYVSKSSICIRTCPRNRLRVKRVMSFINLGIFIDSNQVCHSVFYDSWLWVIIRSADWLNILLWIWLRHWK